MFVCWKISKHYSYLLVFSTSVLLYSNTFSADFVYDDSPAILTNPVVTGELTSFHAWTLDFWGNPLTKASHKSYRPLTTLSFRVNAVLFGLRPQSFHVTNVILHAIASCMVLRIVDRLRIFKDNRGASLFTALLFAAHPIHCEAVAGIVGRADVLSAIAVLSGILIFDRNENILLAGATAAMAMCFKETGIMLLPMLAVFVMLDPKRKSADVRRVISGLIMTFIALATLRHAINGFEAPTFSKSDNPAAHHTSFLVRTLTFLYLPLFHLKLMIDPRKLSFDWSMNSIPLVTSSTEPRSIVTVTFYLVLALICYKLALEGGILNRIWSLLSPDRRVKRKKNVFRKSSAKTKNWEDTSQEALVALSLLILPYLPSTNLFFYVGFVAAERVLYLPSVGYCILLGFIYNCSYKRFGQLFTISSAFILVTLYGTRTYARNFDWKDEESLYKSALDLNPPKAYSNLGRVYAAQIKLDEAEIAYKAALKHRPNMADTWYNLGLLYQDRGNFTSAVKCYENAIKFRRSFASAYLNLGDVHQQVDEEHLAASTWYACSQIDGTMVKAQRDHRQAQTSCRLRLGRLLFKRKDYSEARKVLEEAILTAPVSYPFLASLWFSLGEIYDAQGQDPRAEEALQTALRVTPKHVPSLLTLGYLKNKQNRTNDSNRWFSEALAASPDSVEVYHHIGTAAALRGDVLEAEAAYTAALNLSATHLGTLRALGTLLREQEKYEKCEEVLKTLQTHHPSAESFGDYGAILHLNGKLVKAKEYYEKSLQLEPNNMVVRENLGKLLRKMNLTKFQ